jgi:hypothetical protein
VLYPLPSPQEDSWYSFLLKAVNPRYLVHLEEFGKLRKINDLIWYRTSDLMTEVEIFSFETGKNFWRTV